MEKMAWDGPKWGREDFFPTNPDLANILGRTDLDFENFYFFGFFGVPNFWLGPSLGPLGPSLGPLTWARRGPTHLGPAWAHPLGPGLGPHTWARLGHKHVGLSCIERNCSLFIVLSATP